MGLWKRVLPKRIRRLIHRRRQSKSQDLAFSSFSDALPFKIAISYRPNPENEFARLCDKWGSDKGEANAGPHPYPWPSHTYSDLIESLFGHCKGHVEKVFECGIGTSNPGFPNWMGPSGNPGASLRVWRDYFPRAEIFGADIDDDVLFSEDRIRTTWVDQVSPESIAQMWKIFDGPFDLIVDDGLHQFKAGACLFENSFHRLKPGGLYIIEDIAPKDKSNYVDFFSRLDVSVEFIDLFRPSVPLADNCLIIVRRPLH